MTRHGRRRWRGAHGTAAPDVAECRWQNAAGEVLTATTGMGTCKGPPVRAERLEWRKGWPQSGGAFPLRAALA